MYYPNQTITLSEAIRDLPWPRTYSEPALRADWKGNGLTETDELTVEAVLSDESDWDAGFGARRLIEYHSMDCQLLRCATDAGRAVYAVSWSWGYLGEDGEYDAGLTVWQDEDAARTQFERDLRRLGGQFYDSSDSSPC